MRSFCSLLFYSLLVFCTLNGTTALGRDTPKFRDTTEVNKLLSIGQIFFQQDQLDSAAFYFNKGGEVAREINYKRGISLSSHGRINILNRKGKYAEALSIGLEWVEICQSLGKTELAKANNTLGNIYQYRGDLNSAATHYLNALRLIEPDGDLKSQQLFSNNLASVFLELGEKEKSYQYAYRAYQLALQNNDTSGVASCLVNLGVSETLNERFDQATSYLMQVLQFGRDMQDPSYVLDAYINLGDVEAAKKNYKTALQYYQQAHETLDSYPSPDYELYVYWGLAKVYNHLEMYPVASQFLQKSILIGQSINALKELQKIYLLGSEISESAHDPIMALDFRKKYDALSDSLFSIETQQNIHKLETEYRTSLKEKAIAQQKLIIANNNLEIEKKNNHIFISTAIGIGLLLTVIIFLLIYRNIKKANKGKLRAIQRQNEIDVLLARAEGEEKERTRLARELHDGVGGILSATKMHLSILKNETAIFVAPTRFDHTVSMIDHAAQEIRSIAHNLSPAVFQNYDLDGALASFCKSISNPNLKVEYYFLGEVPTYVHNFRLIIYRIVQELINNIIKHSHATHALVQLSEYENVLSLTVEDNGIGFDLLENNGLGLKNLEQRVKGLKGHMTINSESGNGTTIYMEFDTSSFIVHPVEKTTSIKV